MINDIYQSLHLRQPILEFKSSVFRPNLFYDIQFKELLEDSFQNLCEFIEETKTISDVEIYFFLLINSILREFRCNH